MSRRLIVASASQNAADVVAAALAVREVTCWCESTIVEVSERDASEGRTGSCGRPDCRPDAIVPASRGWASRRP